jgi:archaellum component FlaC
LRASQLDQADEVLRAIEWNKPKDFRFYCLSGFLSVEKDSLAMAAHFFTKAFESARTNSQRIYTLLLKYRALSLDGKKRQAEEVLRLCLNLDRTCPEVVFEEVVSKFDSDRTPEAIKQLFGLINDHREYWTAAIICPDFAAYHDQIVPELEKVLLQARSEGTNLIEQACTSLANLKQTIAEADEEVQELDDRYKEITRLVQKDSYFGWLDSVRSASILVSDCLRSERERRTRIQNVLSGLKERLFSAINSPYAWNGNGRKEIEAIREAIDSAESDLYKLQPHKAILETCSLQAEKLDRLEKRFSELEQRDKMMSRMKAFFKDSVIFLGVVAVLGAAVTPLVLSYLRETDYVATMLSETGVIWIYDTLAVLAVISSICFAVVRGILRGQKGVRHVAPVKR